MTDYEKFLSEIGLTEDDCRAARDGVRVNPMGEQEALRVHIGKSPIEGWGVFASEPIEKFTVIADAFNDGAWSTTGRYMNHSPDPNAEVRVSLGDTIFRSTRYIEMDGEITCNYRNMRAVLIPIFP